MAALRKRSEEGVDSMETWLVTGAGGFVGRHVLDALNRRRGGTDRIVGLSRGRGKVVQDGIEWREVDLFDARGVWGVVTEVKPSRVIHLAGRTSGVRVEDYYRSNILGANNLLRALGESGDEVRFVMAGSAAELGPVPSRFLPASTALPCRPAPGYGLSKWAASKLVQFAEAPVEGIVGRIFNAIGPGMPGNQAFGRFARLLSTAVERPIRLRVGDTEARRDFVDARDVADALVLMAEKGKRGEIYHIGRGESRSVGEGLRCLIEASGLEVVIERGDWGTKSSPEDSVACNKSLSEDTGWRPRISFEESLADLWRECAGGGRLDLMAMGSTV